MGEPKGGIVGGLDTANQVADQILRLIPIYGALAVAVKNIIVDIGKSNDPKYGTFLQEIDRFDAEVASLKANSQLYWQRRAQEDAQAPAPPPSEPVPPPAKPEPTPATGSNPEPPAPEDSNLDQFR